MFIYGIHPVELFVKYKKNLVKKIIINKIENLQKLNFDIGVKFKIQQLDNEKIAQLSGTIDHQGILAEIEGFPYASAIDQSKKSTKICVLDHINDPRNLGAIIRNAVAFGIELIVIPKDRACEITPVVIKASAGTAAIIPIAIETNINRFLADIKNFGYWVYGFEANGNNFFNKTAFSGKTALVFGSEGKGLSSLTRKNCDNILKINFNAVAQSLNVASTTAIVFNKVFNDYYDSSN